MVVPRKVLPMLGRSILASVLATDVCTRLYVLMLITAAPGRQKYFNTGLTSGISFGNNVPLLGILSKRLSCFDHRSPPFDVCT